MTRYFAILLAGLFIATQSFAQTPHLNTNSLILVDPSSGFTLTLLPGTLSANQNATLTNMPGTVSSKTAAYTALSSDRFIFVSNASATGYNITLPTAANKGQLITVTKTDANTNNISVVAASGESIVKIAARTTLTGQGYSVTLVADGSTTWYVVAHEAPDTVAGTQQPTQGN